MKTELIRKYDIIGLAILIGILFSVTTIFFYQKESKDLKRQKNRQLTTIVQFKTKQIAYWYQREINNTISTSNSSLLKSQMLWYLDFKQPGDAFILLQHANQIKSDQNCSNVSLFSVDAGLIVSTDEAFYKPYSAVIQAVHYAGRSRIPTSTEFYQSSTDTKTYIDFIAPIIYDGVLVGFLSCCYEAENTIYPIINEWPESSKTGQTHIYTVSDEGEINLNISESKYPGDTFKLSHPLSTGKPPQIKVTQGFEGIVNTMDYDGNKVLAHVNRIPGTPWYLCVTITEEEIYQELNNYIWLKFVSFLALVLVTALGLIYIFKQRQQNIYKTLYLKEKENWQQKEQFFVTIDSLGEGVITLDAEEKIQYMNIIAEQYTGWNLRDARGRQLSEVYNVKNETTGEKESKILEKILNQGIVKGLSNHTILIAKDGTEIAIEDTGAPVYDPNGSLTGISIVFRDETEKRARERLIVENEERLRQVTENINDVFWLRDASNNKLLYVNPAYEKICERSCQSLYDNPDSFLEIVHESDKIRVYEEFELYRKGGVFDLKYRIVPSGHDFRWVHAQFFPIKNTDGIIIRHVGKVTDITIHKNAEEALRKSEEHYRVLIENMGEGVLLTDNEDVIQFVNRKVCDIYGYEPNELIGKHGYEILEHESSRDLVKEKTKNRLEKMSESYEVLGLKKSGEKLWIRINGAPIYDTKGKVIGSVGILSDITERVLLENDLHHALGQAKESDRLKSAFLANMSHEIRTPLNGIMGFTELMSNPDLTSEKRHFYVEILRTSGIRMLDTINSILEISRIESGMEEITYTNVDLQQTTQYYFNFFKPEAEKKGIELRLKESSTGKRSIVYTDEVKLNSIISNLIKNAIKYTDNGFVEFGFNISDELLFYVKDSGAGIPEEDQERIFDRFIKANDTLSSGNEGLGLGLAIAKGYTEMLGGKIWMNSKPEKGSIFTFTIPDNAPDNVLNNDNEETESAAIFKSEGSTILVAEDEESSYILIEEMLSEFNYHLIRAKNGREAIEIFNSTIDIDLILMDLKMPVLDGQTAIKEIRKRDKNLPIIAISAHALNHYREEALKAGCNEYITKPINVERLVFILKSFLNRKGNG